MRSSIKLLQTDITTLEVDAIVNAANNGLLGGGGVDGAIHRAAGSKLLKECKSLNGCETGKAKFTKAYHLLAKYIIHTVGPIWKNGQHNEPTLLQSCYHESLMMAKQLKCVSVAFPNISTGVYGFPKNEAANIAISEVSKFLKNESLPQVIYFVCFDEENYHIYQKRLTEFRL